MISQYKKALTAITAVLLGAVMQAYAGIGFAPGTPGINSSSIEPQQISAILTTAGNRPISVNGAGATTGATILSGALVETPGKVGATINIPGHAVVDIAPDTRFLMEFDQNGNLKITLREGCVTLHAKKGTAGEIDTSQGVAGKTDPAKDDVLRVCFPRGAAAPIVDTGVVVGAGAGGGGGVSGVTIAGIVLGGTAAAVGLAFGLRGNNPSPSTP